MASPEVTASLKLRDDMSPALHKAGQNVGGFQSVIRTATGTMLGFLGADVLRNVLTFVGEAVSAAAATDKLNKQTEAVIKSTGGAAHVTASQVDTMAESLKRMSGVNDEVIKNGENLLLTFTGIQNRAGKGNDIFNQATKIMLDLSVALGQDTATSSIQLGKALNDPIKGMASLSRVGVAFSAGQREQIANLMKHGDLLGAQKVILAELTKEFGGSAAAAGKSSAGLIAGAQAAIDDAKRALAGVLMPMIGAVAGEVAKVANAFTDWLEANRPLMAQVGAFTSGALRLLFDLVGRGAGFIAAIASSFQSWNTHMGATASTGEKVSALLYSVVSALGFAPEVIEDIGVAFAGLVDTYQRGLGPIFADLATLWNTVVVPALVQLGAGLLSLEPRFAAMLAKIQPVVAIVMMLADQYLKNLIDILSKVLPPAINLVVAVLGTLFDAIGVVATLFVDLWALLDDLFHGRWGKLWGDVQRLFYNLVLGLTGIIANLVVAVGRFFGELVDNIVGKKGSVPVLFAQVVQWFKDLPGAILKGIASLDKLLYQKGWDLIQGLWNGVTAKWREMLNGFSALVSALPDPIKKALGIRSPSTVMAEVGRNFVLGMQQGITRTWPGLSRTVGGLPMPLPGRGGLSSGLAGGGLFGAGEVHLHVEIAEGAFIDGQGVDLLTNGITRALQFRPGT